MTKREFKARREYAINKCVSVLTDNNGIDIMLLGKLGDKLDKCDMGDLSMIIASQYSPEGPMTWQAFMKLELPLTTNTWMAA
jgi:hypothetical protein